MLYILCSTVLLSAPFIAVYILPNVLYSLLDLDHNHSDGTSVLPTLFTVV